MVSIITLFVILYVICHCSLSSLTLYFADISGSVTRRHCWLEFYMIMIIIGRRAERAQTCTKTFHFRIPITIPIQIAIWNEVGIIVWIATKDNHLVLGLPLPSKKFPQNPSSTFGAIQQANKQTDWPEIIASFSRGNNNVITIVRCTVSAVTNELESPAVASWAAMVSSMWTM